MIALCDLTPPAGMTEVSQADFFSFVNGPWNTDRRDVMPHSRDTSQVSIWETRNQERVGWSATDGVSNHRYALRSDLLATN